MNAKEFEYMVEAGMTPLEAIMSATRNAAELLGSKDVGSIQPGRYADLVAVRQDLLKDVRVLQSVEFVMKVGTVHKKDGRPVLKEESHVYEPNE